MPSANKTKTPWPTKKAMAQVYDLQMWGSNGDPFYSGEGSHHQELVRPYVAVVSSFLKSFKTPITVCDLGCGDFNIGRQLLAFTQSYTAVDIVPDLIAHNQKQFTDDRLQFKCIDIAVDSLPQADCAIVRQVMQHLSNAEIAHICSKLKAYRYVLLTEHVPVGHFTPNVDIISGQGIRLRQQSGVDLLAPPFGLTVTSATQLLVLPSPTFGGQVVTTLLRMF